MSKRITRDELGQDPQLLRIALLATIVALVTTTASAQSWEVGYDASFGTLPSAQGWMIQTSDPAPFDGLDEGNYLVAGGALIQGGTEGINNDAQNSQWYELALPEIDFEREVLEIEFRVRILAATGTHPEAPEPGIFPDAGFGVQLVDDHTNAIKFAMSTSFLMLDRFSGFGLEDHAFNTSTGSFKNYRIRVEADRTIVFVEGVETLIQPTARPVLPGLNNILRFGDLSNQQSSSSELEYIRLSRHARPTASVRNYTVVSETTISSSATTQSRIVSCPAGSFALSGGVEPIGPNGNLAVVWSKPVVGTGLPTSWYGKAREIVPTGADWSMRVDVICGEVPGLTVTSELISPSTTAAYKMATVACDEGLFSLGGGMDIVGPEQNIAMISSTPKLTSGDQGFRGSASDFENPVSASAWTVEAHALCTSVSGFEIVSSSTDSDGFDNKSAVVNCPSGTWPISGGAFISGDETNVAMKQSRPKDGAPGGLPVGWQADARATSGNWFLSVQAVCAPIADPTVENDALVARYQGADAGFDSWGEGHGTAHGGVGYPSGSAGLMGTAFEFDGSDGQRVELPSIVSGTSHDLYFDDSFTIDAWIQSDGVTRGEGNRIAMLYDWGGTNNGGGTNPSTFILMLDSNGYAYGAQRAWAPSAPIESVVGSTPLDDGEPHHIALVRDTKTSYLTLYVDGLEVDSHFMNPGFSAIGMQPGNPSDPDPVTLGGGYALGDATTTSGFEGLINDVKFFKRRLVASEIEEIAGCGVPVLPRIINLDANRFGSPASESHGLCTRLAAGDYLITIVSPDDDPLALHTGWSPDETGAWGTEVQIDPEIDPGAVFGQVPLYGSAQEAFNGLTTKAFVLNLTTDQRVDFSVEDLLNLDNRGGVSLRIEEYVPEPGFGLGLLSGVIMLAARSRRGRDALAKSEQHPS